MKPTTRPAFSSIDELTSSVVPAGLAAEAQDARTKYLAARQAVDALLLRYQTTFSSDLPPVGPWPPTTSPKDRESIAAWEFDFNAACAGLSAAIAELARITSLPQFRRDPTDFVGWFMG